MAHRKQSPPTPCLPEDEKYSKVKYNHLPFFNNQFTYFFAIFISLLLWLFALFYFFPAPKTTTIATITGNNLKPTETLIPKCYDSTLLVYVYQLPAEFNLGLLNDCRKLNVYTDMCPHVQNFGLGQPLTDMDSTGSWYATHQFIAEMIFHARVTNHPCRAWDPARASLFYVPFYGGLHASSKFREMNHTVRDALAIRLARFLQNQPWWERNHGKDHFLALGRTAWDFMRVEGEIDFGANCLLNLPPVKNMTVLTVERQPWNGSNQFGIPYPSYFHPSTSAEMVKWQNKMRHSDRPHLFTFIGAPRKNVGKAAIRDELIRQCSNSTRCKLLKCGKGASLCHNPTEVLKVMSSSQFCLQAPGDSFTRRSTFDSILSGCIPVFFSPHTAYTQYKWFLPADTKSYSVFIDGDSMKGKKIENELTRISAASTNRMRKIIIDLIPKITYANPNSSSIELGFRDAVDVALAALSKKVESNLKDM